MSVSIEDISGRLQLDRIRSSIQWSQYIPTNPTPKQLSFMMLPHREALYGGAAGGGKSEALLADALRYVDIPGYSAILFRRKLTDHKLPSAMLSRAHSWLYETDAKWDAGNHTYIFPSGATVVFGYMDTAEGKYRYASSEYQFIGFDELSHWEFEEDYSFLFSRLRRNRGIDIPLRVRSATNPGGPGHQWIRDRFQIDYNAEKGKFIGHHPKRPFIPANLYDNPFIDQESYAEALEDLDEITRAHLKDGNWDLAVKGRFSEKWHQTYDRHGEYYRLGYSGKDEKAKLHTPQSLYIFQTLDPAASTKEGPGDDMVFRQRMKASSWTVLSTWAMTRDYQLLLLDVVRGKFEIPDILVEARKSYRKWKPSVIICERNGLGQGVYQMLNKIGLPMYGVYATVDKLVAATDAINRSSKGQVWYPQDTEAFFMKEWKKELYTWVGHPAQADDQIDTLSMAAKHVSHQAAFSEIDPEDQLTEGAINMSYDQLISITPDIW